MRNRRRILGDAWVDRSVGNATAFSADFQALITRYAWHEVWGRPGLDARVRRLLVLVITAALGRWEEFELHCRASLAGGERATRLTPEEIKEALIQTAIYAGVPAANTAHAITTKLLRELAASDHEDAAAFAAQVAPKPATEAVHPGVGRTQRTLAGGPAVAFSVLEPRGARRDGGAVLNIVLSHALGVDRSMWDALAVELAAEHRVVCYDHRGHGGSAAPPGACTLEQLADDALRVIDAAIPPGEKVVFIGLSMGGMVAQQLALRHPQRVQALVLANTASEYSPQAREVWQERIATVASQGLEAIADGTMQRWFTAAFRAAQPATVERIRRRVVSQDPLGYMACCHAIAALDLTQQLTRISCPTLVIAGADDQGTPPEWSEKIARQIPGSRFLVLPQAAHLSAVEQPAAFSAAVQVFLAGLSLG